MARCHLRFILVTETKTFEKDVLKNEICQRCSVSKNLVFKEVQYLIQGIFSPPTKYKCKQFFNKTRFAFRKNFKFLLGYFVCILVCFPMDAL